MIKYSIIASDKVLRDKAFNIGRNPSFMYASVDFHQWFIYKVFDMKSSGGA